jgi:homoserine kinase type II
MQKLPEPLLNALGATSNFEVKSLDGNENDNYLVRTAGDAFVVKRLRSVQSAANVELEGIYRRYLADADLPVSCYLPLRDDYFVLAVNHDKYVATPYIAGETAPHTKDVAREAATLLAKIHRLDTAGLPQRLSWFRKTYIPESLPLIGDKFSAAKQTFAERYKNVPDFWSDDLPKGIIHGDLQDENMIVDTQNKVVSIIDWEEAAIEPLLLDVAHAAQQIAFYHGGNFNEELFTAFMNAYQSVRPLASLEKKLFDKALQYTMLLLSIWVHIKASRHQLDEDIFERVGNYYTSTFDTPPIL